MKERLLQVALLDVQTTLLGHFAKTTSCKMYECLDHLSGSHEVRCKYNKQACLAARPTGRADHALNASNRLETLL